jgi:L-threonylcarbamoyladenylate synthase
MTEIKTKILSFNAPYDLNLLSQSVSALQTGKLVAFATETVYGLGVNALNQAAVMQLYKIKNRPLSLPLALHLGSVEAIKDWVLKIPDWAGPLIDKFLPGPLMIILLKNSKVPDYLTSGNPKIGIRVPSHPFARTLLQAVKIPVAATSANLHGQPSPISAQEVYAQLNGVIDYILESSEKLIGQESTIIDLTEFPAKILRLGAISRESLNPWI